MFPSCRRLPPPLPVACSLGQSPRLRIESDPRTRVSVPRERGHEKTLPAAGSEGFGGKSPMIKWRYAAPSPFEPVARYSDPQGNRRAWPWPLASERLGALQASSIGCIRFDITRSHRSCGRGGGTRTPADAVLETAALAAELHLFRKPPNKKAASVSSGRLADLGLVVSRFKTSTSAPRRP